jgi:hypothetical protein
MERRFVNRPNWTRILERRFKLSYVENDDFAGYISALYMDKVREPLVKEVAGQSLCIVDNRYIFLQHLPNNEHYSLTTMYDASGELVQWYFDITRQNGVDKEGMPFFDDLYLDVVVLPTGQINLLDELELEEALKTKDITQSEYDMAYEMANKIINGIGKDVAALRDFTDKYLEYMQKA